MGAESDDLAYLRYAWGDVYCVEHKRLWTAHALWGDGHTLRADTADELLGKILKRIIPFSATCQGETRSPVRPPAWET